MEEPTYYLEMFCPICKKWDNYGLINLWDGLDAIIKCTKCNNNIYVVEITKGSIKVMFTSKGLNALGTTKDPGLGTSSPPSIGKTYITDEERTYIVNEICPYVGKDASFHEEGVCRGCGIQRLCSMEAIKRLMGGKANAGTGQRPGQ